MIDKKKHTHKKLKITGLIIIGIFLVTVLVCLIYVNNKSRCTDPQALSNTDLTQVTIQDDCIFLDGPGVDNALIFYPGGKVESESYCHMLKKISDAGIDVIITKPLFSLQILDINQASTIMNRFDYKNWTISGHSLGGVVAGMFCSRNQDAIRNIIFLASYSSNDISDDVDNSLLITAQNDGVMKKNEYYECLSNLPDNRIEYEIQGGNHQQFGCYNAIDNEPEASISSEEQQNITAYKILDFLKYSFHLIQTD